MRSFFELEELLEEEELLEDELEEELLDEELLEPEGSFLALGIVLWIVFFLFPPESDPIPLGCIT